MRRIGESENIMITEDMRVGIKKRIEMSITDETIVMKEMLMLCGEMIAYIEDIDTETMTIFTVMADFMNGETGIM